MNRLDGKVALVTGAAGGIGRATVALFVEAGARVLATDLDAAGEDRLRGVVGDQDRLRYLPQDVTDPVAWQRVVEVCTETFGGLDVLVNNAGVGRRERFEELTLEEWRGILAVNLDSVFMGIQTAVRAMGARGGSIVNLSSIMGLVGGAGAAYNASKGGVRLLTKSVASWCARESLPIRVNSVHPGFIDTPMVTETVLELDAERDGVTPDEALADIIARHPMGRLGKPEEIARGILFLASDDASFMTGSELVIDGGYTAV